MTPPTRMLTAFMIVPPELRPREVLGVVSPVARGIDDEPREDCFPPEPVIEQSRIYAKDHRCGWMPPGL